MEKQISVLSDVRRVAQLLAKARVQKIEVASHGRKSAVAVSLIRAKVEEAFDSQAKMPLVDCELVFNGVFDVKTQPKRFAEKTDLDVVECEAVKGGYRCYVTTPEGDEMVLAMPALAGTFRDL